MITRPLRIPDAFEFTPTVHRDERGAFLEWYRHEALSDVVGHRLDLRQGNLSISARGTLRGIHFADVPRGQAKYVTAVRGSVMDFVVDVRAGSPTFGQWDAVLLDDREHRAVYLAEGLGHAFLALEDDTVVTYLVSDVYSPSAEHGIHPLDPGVGLELPIPADHILLSPKDAAAPSLEEALGRGDLPDYELCVRHYEQAKGERA